MPDIIRGTHRWVGAATIAVAPQQAPSAVRRGTLRVLADTQVDVLEVYCAACKRPYDDIDSDQCVVGEHLRGGPIGERKKRKGLTPEGGPDAVPGTQALPGP